jgi:biotin carboxylase
MPHLLLITTTTGYQTRAFEGAAQRAGVELVYATDRCKGLEDPWRDGAIPVRFHDPAASVRAIVDAARTRPLEGIVALGDQAAVLAAHVARALGLPGNPPQAAAAAASKLLTRGRLVAGGLPAPWFFSMPLDAPIDQVADRLAFPCVIKPLALSGSRGVIRADSPAEFEAAVARVREILLAHEIRRLNDPANDEILVEGFVPGAEYALEGILEQGALRVLAIFEKPDPLDGPYFEETIYATPPRLAHDTQRAMAGAIAHAAAAIGLRHGPIHAECRLSGEVVFVLEVAARPIGGLCARALRFVTKQASALSLEDLLVRHALGGSLDGYGRERVASAVMMIPIPHRGHFHAVRGIEEARGVPGVDDVVVTAKPGQLMLPLPEGHSYLGFIFARAGQTAEAIDAVREAHQRLEFRFDSSLPVVSYFP